MPVYQAPGVYVEEVKGTPPITPVGTSTAAFLGTVDAGVQMPFKPGSATDRFTLVGTDVPTLVTSFEQFKNFFGDFQTGNLTLAHAVYGFFNNGGSRCWVVRVDDLTNAGHVDAALTKLEPIDEVALVAAPGALDAAAQLKLIEHCENMKSRFAIIDGQRATTVTKADIQGTLRDSDYAAMYFPWIQVYDPVSNGPVYMPPSGYMAGIYARVDQERGVHKAPANEFVMGALDVEYPVSKNEQAGVNLDGINIIRDFQGNIKVWGARTLGGKANGEFIYINVRRLMIFLRESIEQGTQFVVFEPNNTQLWQKIIRSVGGFLTNVWRDGALFGDTAAQAFYVKCDESTNPPAVRDLGQVVTEIGVAIVKPAEFVIFRISQVTLPSA